MSASLCPRPSVTHPVPHLLVVDIGKDTGDDLQQKDDEEQHEVLGRGARRQ